MPKPITTQPPTTGPFTAGPINQTLWLSGSVLSRRTLTGHMTDKVSFSQLSIMAATRTRPKSLFLYLSLGWPSVTNRQGLKKLPGVKISYLGMEDSTLFTLKILNYFFLICFSKLTSLPLLWTKRNSFLPKMLL